MSFAADLEDDENPQDPNQASKTDSGVSLGGGGSGVASPGTSNPGSSSTGQAGEGTKPSSSGAWTNLQSYLDANQDQSSQMGSGVAGDVSGKAQRAQDETTSAASDFENQVNSNTVQADPDAVSGAISKATGLKASDTYGDDDAAAFQKQANASYGGPTDFTAASGYQQAQKDSSDAQTGLTQLGSESGRDVLLQNRYQNASQNGYNQGEQNLDQMLLENNPQNQQAFSQTRDRWTGIGSLLGDMATAENGRAGKAMATDQATAAAAQKALSDASSKFQSDLQAQLGTSTTGNQTAYNQALADLKSNTLTPAELAAMGLTQGENTYGADPSQFLQKGLAPTLFNTATADQYAEAAALAKLAGQDSSTFLPGADASQAGTANPYGFDTGGFNAAVTAAKAGMQNQISDFMNNSFYPAVYQGSTPANGQAGEMMTPQNFLTDFPTIYQQALAEAQTNGGTMNNWSGQAKLQALQALVPKWEALNKLLTEGINGQASSAPAVPISILRPGGVE